MLTTADKIHLGCVWTLGLLAVLLNSLLIFAIVFRTPKVLRSYSMFLLCNALIDLISAITSSLGTVRVLTHESLIIFVFIGPCAAVSEDFCRMCHAVHVHLVQQSSIVLLLSFAYRLYVLGDAHTFRRAPPPSRVALLCLLTLAIMAPEMVGIYLELESVSLTVIKQLNLQEYAASSLSSFGTIGSILVLTYDIVMSPAVMTAIFIVRRKLLQRIALSQPKEKRHHATIARALTYQFLLPLGVGIAALMWILDYCGVWSNELTQRSILFLCSMYSLASPLINFTFLPAYRGLMRRKRKTMNGTIVSIEQRNSNAI